MSHTVCKLHTHTKIQKQKRTKKRKGAWLWTISLMFCVSPTETIIYNFCSHSQVTMSVLGQIPSVTAYVLFQEKAQEYFQEKAQATIPTFLERTCAPSHNTYCRSCLSSCSINIVILTAQEFTPFQELLMVISRDSCYSSHRSEHSQYYEGFSSSIQNWECFLSLPCTETCILQFGTRTPSKLA